MTERMNRALFEGLLDAASYPLADAERDHVHEATRHLRAMLERLHAPCPDALAPTTAVKPIVRP